MALIKCSECGREISDKASVCMNCGNPIENNECIKENKVEKYDIISLCGFIISLIAIFVSLWGLFTILGLVLSIIGFINVTNNNYKLLSVVGIIVSGVGLLIKIIQLILLILLWVGILGQL